MALVEFDQGKTALAVAHLEKSLVLLSKVDTTSRAAAELKFHLARALWVRGGQRQRAVELAKQARTALQTMPPGEHEHLAEITGWLSKND